MFFTLLVILAFALLYWFPVRRWMSRWGTNPFDLGRVMAGDALLVTATYSGTMTVWQFGLYSIGEQRTKLVSRSRVRARTV
jgi:hypothetical protein